MFKSNITDKYNSQLYKGEIEFIIRDRFGNVVARHIEPNIIKIFAKEILAHRMFHSKVWDPIANSGSGAWVKHDVDPLEEFSVKYILFGASFDENGKPLESNDSRYYDIDPITQLPIPKRLNPGADFDGGLINAIPIAEPYRPLKKIESINFEPTYNPAGTPQLQSDVRAMNNVVLLSTTLTADEYNGFNLNGTNGGDSFTITEVALAGGKEIDIVGNCECDPKELFLDGDADGNAISATANGTDVISIDADITNVDSIRVGDQIKITDINTTSSSAAYSNNLNQVSSFYLVIDKLSGGRDLQLDRVPSDSNQNPIVGSVGVFRSTLRIFSHRILQSPVVKTKDFEIQVIWRIIFS